MTQPVPPRGQSFEHGLDQSDKTVAAFKSKKRGLLGTIQHGLHGNPTMVPVIVLLLSVAVFGLVAGGKFFSAFNLTLIMQQVSIIGMLAAAQSLIILTAGIDLSVAAIMVLMSVIAGNLAEMFLHLTPADDLQFRDARNAPTCLVEGMTIAGR